jgi:hypothetical protein
MGTSCRCFPLEIKNPVIQDSYYRPVHFTAEWSYSSLKTTNLMWILNLRVDVSLTVQVPSSGFESL